jgi:hypothetical protein
MSQDCLSQEPLAKEPVSILQAVKAYLLCLVKGVLRLRRVQFSLATILVSLLIMNFPALESLGDDLMLLIVAILMVGLGGYSVGDALSNGQPEYERLEELLEAVADDLGVEVDEAVEAPAKEVQDAEA